MRARSAPRRAVLLGRLDHFTARRTAPPVVLASELQDAGRDLPAVGGEQACARSQRGKVGEDGRRGPGARLVQGGERWQLVEHRVHVGRRGAERFPFDRVRLGRRVVVHGIGEPQQRHRRRRGLARGQLNLDLRHCINRRRPCPPPQKTLGSICGLDSSLVLVTSRNCHGGGFERIHTAYPQVIASALPYRTFTNKTIYVRCTKRPRDDRTGSPGNTRASYLAHTLPPSYSVSSSPSHSLDLKAVGRRRYRTATQSE